MSGHDRFDLRGQLKACSSVTTKDWIQAVVDTLEPHEGEGGDHRPRNIKRALTNLIASAHSPISIDNETVTWIGPQEDLDNASSAS